MREMTASPVLGRPQVVIVEDDPAVRRSLQLLLQGQGFAVRAYASGEALTSDAAMGNAACLVADYKLDALDGVSLLSRVRSKGWQGPAVLVTAYPSTELSERAVRAGYAAVFEKPLRERSLSEAIWRLVQTGSAGSDVFPNSK